ncbi:hypothetical protein JHK87_042778 [Glycine soja]|nr:hypothetical protein JHK87_042778 [Glycine soja]
MSRSVEKDLLLMTTWWLWVLWDVAGGVVIVREAGGVTFDPGDMDLVVSVTTTRYALAYLKLSTKIPWYLWTEPLLQCKKEILRGKSYEVTGSPEKYLSRVEKEAIEGKRMDEVQELKDNLLRRYSGYITNLKHEISKKK